MKIHLSDTIFRVTGAGGQTEIWLSELQDKAKTDGSWPAAEPFHEHLLLPVQGTAAVRHHRANPKPETILRLPGSKTGSIFVVSHDRNSGLAWAHLESADSQQPPLRLGTSLRNVPRFPELPD